MNFSVGKSIAGIRKICNGIVRYKREHARGVRVVSTILFSLLLLVTVILFYQPLLDAFQISLDIGWKFCIVLLLFPFWNLIASRGWKSVVDAFSDVPGISLRRLYIIRIEGQAINTVLPFSGVGSEVLRSARLSDILGLGKSVGAVTVDKILDLAAGVVLAIPGVLLLVLPDMTNVTAGIAMSGYAVFCAVLVYVLPSLWNGMLLRLPARLSKNWNGVMENSSRLGVSLRKCFAAHYMEHMLIAAEIVVISWLLGIRIGIRDILVIKALLSMSELLFMVVPGKLGSVECSMALGFSMLSLPVEAGLSVAIIRRARQLIVCLTGLVFLLVGRKSGMRGAMAPAGPVPGNEHFSVSGVTE